MGTDPLPLLEPSDLVLLREIVGSDLVMLLEQFLKDTAAEVVEMGQCLQRYDLPRALLLAHSLRGASAQVGARALAQHAGNIETELEYGHIHALPPLLEQLTHCMQQTEQTYRAYIMDSSPSV